MSLAPRVLISLVAVFALAPAAAHAQVKVAKRPVEVERKTFDPKSPPPEMPPLHGNEAAVTVAKFFIRTQVEFTPVSSRKGKGDVWTAKIRTQQVQIDLALKVIIWLPEGAGEPLKAHEEGHRQIVEDVYKTAEKVAAKIGQTYVGRGGSATGPNATDAQRDALKALMKQCADEYMAATEKRAERVNAVYDELTAHGTKSEPFVAEAIKLSFEQLAKEEAEAKTRGKTPAPKK